MDTTMDVDGPVSAVPGDLGDDDEEEDPDADHTSPEEEAAVTMMLLHGLPNPGVTPYGLLAECASSPSFSRYHANQYHVM